jgi:hypothetical protein
MATQWPAVARRTGTQLKLVSGASRAIVLVVAGNHNGYSGAYALLDERAQAPPGGGIQSCVRFIEQHNIRLQRQRTREQDAARLSV